MRTSFSIDGIRLLTPSYSRNLLRTVVISWPFCEHKKTYFCRLKARPVDTAILRHALGGEYHAERSSSI